VGGTGRDRLDSIDEDGLGMDPAVRSARGQCREAEARAT
jgi:hypothetical protein